MSIRQVLPVVEVVLVVGLLTGIVVTIRGLTGEPGPVREVADVELRKRLRNHLAFGALDVCVVVAVLFFLNIYALVLGAIPGLIASGLAILVILSALATVLDRHMGPLPSTARDSRRRGAVAGLTIVGVCVVYTALTSDVPLFQLSAAPVAGIAYAAVTGLQWYRVTARQAQYSR